MLRTPRILTSLAAALALAALLAPTAAHADLHVGLGLGGALPWDPVEDRQAVAESAVFLLGPHARRTCAGTFAYPYPGRSTSESAPLI